MMRSMSMEEADIPKFLRQRTQSLSMDESDGRSPTPPIASSPPGIAGGATSPLVTAEAAGRTGTDRYPSDVTGRDVNTIVTSRS